MFTFLLVLQAIIATALVAVILMQRSEGGGLTGGNPSGLMSARGAADFLTRTTSILAGLFILLSIALAGLAAVERGPREIDTSLARTAPATPAGDVPLAGDPLTGVADQAGNVAAPAAPSSPAPAPATNGAVPLAD